MKWIFFLPLIILLLLWLILAAIFVLLWELDTRKIDKWDFLGEPIVDFFVWLYPEFLDWLEMKKNKK